MLGLAGLAVAVGVSLLQFGYALGNGWVLVALCVAAALAERASVRLSDTTELSISPVLTLFAAVLFGPLAGGVVGAASELGDSELFGPARHGRSVHLKWMTYTSTRFMAGAAMGLTAEAVQERVDVDGRALRRDDRCLGRRRSAGDRVRDAHEPCPRQPRRHRADGRPSHGDGGVRLRAGRRALWRSPTTRSRPGRRFLFLAPALAAQQLFSLYQEKARLYEEQLSLYAGPQGREHVASRREPLVRDGARSDA